MMMKKKKKTRQLWISVAAFVAASVAMICCDRQCQTSQLQPLPFGCDPI